MAALVIEIFVSLALDPFDVETMPIGPLALKLQFQCQKEPALELALEFPIGVEIVPMGVETAPIGAGTAPIGVGIGVETSHWRWIKIPWTKSGVEDPLGYWLGRRFLTFSSGLGSRYQFETHGACELCWPPAGIRDFSDIQKVRTLISVIFDLN